MRKPRVGCTTQRSGRSTPRQALPSRRRRTSCSMCCSALGSWHCHQWSRQSATCIERRRDGSVGCSTSGVFGQTRPTSRPSSWHRYALLRNRLLSTAGSCTFSQRRHLAGRLRTRSTCKPRGGSRVKGEARLEESSRRSPSRPGGWSHADDSDNTQLLGKHRHIQRQRNTMHRQALWAEAECTTHVPVNAQSHQLTSTDEKRRTRPFFEQFLHLQ